MRFLLWYINGLVQGRRNCIPNALGLRPSCTNPTIYLGWILLVICVLQTNVSAICSPLTTPPHCRTPMDGWLASGWKSRVLGLPALDSNVPPHVDRLRGVLGQSLTKQQKYAPRYHSPRSNTHKITPYQEIYHNNSNKLELPKCALIHMGTSYLNANTFM